MGRKIPGKKHRTVKDPYKQQQTRLEKLKINNPPSNIHEQEMPKRLLEIMELRAKAKKEAMRKSLKKKKVPAGKNKEISQKTKTPSKKEKKNRLLSIERFLDKEPIPKGATKPDKFIPKIVQRPNESNRSFLGRISLMTQNLINEIEFEKKFGVEIKKDENTGEVVEIKNVKSKKKKSKKKKLTEKRKEKLIQKKESLRCVKDFSQLKDRVEFGEVVHRPPDLTAIKKGKVSSQKQKYSNLLLSNVVKDTPAVISQSNLQREKAENERKFIVEAYRRVKKQKRV